VQAYIAELRDPKGVVPKLSAKQQRFVEEYLKDCNASAAYVRAGYSAKTAVKQGSRLLTYADIQAYIAELRDPKGVVAKLTAKQQRFLGGVPR
jgi:phage terminase small subunit